MPKWLKRGCWRKTGGKPEGGNNTVYKTGIQEILAIVNEIMNDGSKAKRLIKSKAVSL